MKKLFFSLIFVFCILMGVSAVAESDAYTKTGTYLNISDELMGSTSFVNVPVKSKAFICVYSDGILRSVFAEEYRGDKISYALPEAAECIKVLVWNGVQSLTPVTDGEVHFITKPEDNYIATVEGFVTGTYYTDDRLSVNELRIKTVYGDMVWQLSDNVATAVDLEVIYGKRVVVYYSNAEECIKSINEKNNEVICINEQDIESISGNTVKYITESGRINSINVDGASFIYNGKPLKNAVLSDFAQGGKYELKSGYIEYLDNGKEKFCKITGYKIFVVNSFDRTNKKIYFKYNQKLDGNNYYEFPAKSSEVPEIYLNGKATELDNLSLSAYDVINFAFSPEEAGGNEINRMFITRGAKSGKVTAKFDDDRELEIGEKTIFIAYNYAEYEPEASGEQKAPFEIDETYSYYLDYMGQIAAVKYSATTTIAFKYGYIMTAGKDESTNSVLIRMINESGADIKYGVKSSIKIDGVKVSSDGILNVLEETSAVANKAYYNVKGGLASNLYNQPIRYSLSGGVIDAIDTVVKEDGGMYDSFSYDVKYDAGETTVNSKTSLTVPGDFGNVAVASSTKIFFIPKNRNDYNSYNKLSQDKAFAKTGKRNIEIMNIDTNSSSKTVAVVLIFDDDPSIAFAYNSPYMLVEGVNGEEQPYSFEGYVNSSASLSTVYLSEDKFTTTIADDDEFVNSIPCVTADKVEKGDIIRYILDVNKKIIAIQIVYDASNPQQNKKAESAENAYNIRCDDIRYGTSTSTISFRYGVPVNIDSDLGEMMLSYILSSDNLGADLYDYAVNYRCSNAKIFEYKNGRITKIDSFEELATNPPEKVVVISNTALTQSSYSGVARFLYVIR